MSKRFEEALADPKSVFGEPQAVLDAADLTTAQKRELLSRWETDSRELQVAAEEGMGGGEPNMLQRVRDALRTLEAGENNAGPPNKQGG